MTDHFGGPATWPLDQQAIWERCRHPAGAFVDFPRQELEQSVPERFAAQVRRHATRLAVRGTSGGLTYEALDARSNGVAHALLARSGERGEPVALLLERDVSLIVAIMGVLKAGKVYVPLDPALPDGRLAELLRSTGARLMAIDHAQTTRAAGLGWPSDAVLDVSALDAAGPGPRPDVVVSPDADALVLYTSGSTARPKGVVHTHRNVLQMVMNHTRHLHICAEDAITLLFSPAFVGSVSDVFGALLNGAAVCPIDLRRDGLGGLAARLDADRVTIYHSVTTTFRQFAQSLPAGPCLPALRLLHVGGEPVTPQDLDAYRARFSPECVFLNMLGTTETGNFRICYVDKSAGSSTAAVAVGYSFADKDVLLLDDDGRRVAPDAVGEIVVRSRYLSPGYWRDPESSAAAFRRDPSDGTLRRYHTGDLGAMRPDGCLEHRGRKDQQVKIRGYRIEVAAVEAALLEYPALREAAVVAHAGASGDARLVAYVVPASTPPPTVGALRDFAAARLAEYMRPSAFVVLDALPLTHTGKVDRRRLPTVTPARPELPRALAAPRSPLEVALVALWAEVLELDAVGVHDTFLELGGNSLLAFQIATRVRAAWGVTLPPQALLGAPTVAHMARAVHDALVETASAERLAELLRQIER